ncbi:MAG: penicillin-binding protein 2 [Acidimicrobiaceae bacterium]|nr:penicillin-binding protein 2 [Acidimicrobiaceae bacterium]
MIRRRHGHRRRLANRLELPRQATPGSLDRLRSALGAGGATRSSALDALDAQEKAELSAREPGRPRFALRLSVTAVVVAVAFSVLVVRLWSIQVIRVKDYRSQAIQTTTRQVAVPAPRGEILARGGQVLAGDRPEDVVTLKTTIDASTTPATRVASTETEQNLAALIPGLTVKQIRSQLNNEQYGPYQPVPVAEGINPQQFTTIKENPSAFPGASVVQEYVRNYPAGDLASQMLGYLGPITCPAGDTAAQCTTVQQQYSAKGYQPTDLIGTTGLEFQYESVLRGKEGVKTVQVDPSGNLIQTTSSTPSTPGNDVVLNLDVGLQQALNNAMVSQVNALRSGSAIGATGPVPADWGAAVVMNANTGAVLAIDSYPGYNNNEWVGGISQKNYNALKATPGNPLNDYALEGLQPPGSTFKISTATAALDDGLISTGSYIDDPGYFNQYGLSLHDSNGESFGPINVTTALTVSSDVFFYTLGAEFWVDRSRFGQTPIQNVANKYGYGAPSGIDLPGEYPGFVDSPALRTLLHKENPAVYPASSTSWYLGDNVELAFGQGTTLVTPLEEAEAYATFANGGTRYAPEMAGAIVGPNDKLVRRIAPKAKAHVTYAPGVYQAMLSGFEGVVQQPHGTAYAAFTGFPFSKWDVAGKTGTADVSLTSTKQPTAWFVAFGGPKNSSTRYVVAVEIDQAGYGAAASAPVARSIFDYLYAHQGVGALNLPGKG